ncbi:MAG TPA: hypothetical protein DD465_18810, partial [Thalassospira sp.]|nr:hypothetical protein [Thalassospira sp.]
GWRGAAGRIGCQRAGGAFGDAETWVIDGGICVPAIRQRCCPWGEVRFGATESERRSGQRGPSGAWAVRSVAFGDAGGRGVGWLAGLVWRLTKTVIPGEAQRRPGIHAPLKETGFPPSRE